MKGDRYFVYHADARYEGRDFDDCLYHMRIWARGFRVTVKMLARDGSEQVVCSMDAGADEINWR